MYYNGIGTSQNYAEARRWCIKAAKQGNADAQRALAVFGTDAGTVTKLEYLELVPSLVLGSWVLLDFLLRGRKHLNFRNEYLRHRSRRPRILYVPSCLPRREAGLNRNRMSDHRNGGLTCEEAKCCHRAVIERDWRNIAITLIDKSMSVIAVLNT